MSSAEFRSLTPQQRVVFSMVSHFYEITQEATPASFIARRIGLSKQRVAVHFRSLNKLGWLRGPGSPALPARRLPPCGMYGGGDRAVKHTREPAIRGVYFARAGDYVKIGYSVDIAVRLATLATAVPGKLTLLGHIDGTFHTEARVHELFSELRMNGEWFRADPRLLSWIESHKRR